MRMAFSDEFRYQGYGENHDPSTLHPYIRTMGEVDMKCRIQIPGLGAHRLVSQWVSRITALELQRCTQILGIGTKTTSKSFAYWDTRTFQAMLNSDTRDRGEGD